VERKRWHRQTIAATDFWGAGLDPIWWRGSLAKEAWGLCTWRKILA